VYDAYQDFTAMDLTNLNKHPHVRFNPLLREWVQVSPNRTERPWRGQVEPIAEPAVREFDSECYLCPGNTRVDGRKNPQYESTFVFDNDFPALAPSLPEAHYDESGLLVARAERGICRVLCFSPRHDRTLSRMSPNEIRAVVDAWIAEYVSLAKKPDINYVTIFENRGAMMGASNLHPHCQIWATATIPNEPAKEAASLVAHRDRYGECLLCAYLKTEARLKDRLVFENKEFAVIVPFWAVWPFETIVMSKSHIGSMVMLEECGRNELVAALKNITARYDNLFDFPFPYSMGFHQGPVDSKPHDESHLHAHFYPPLLRSANIRKFMVGFEMLGTPQRDITPETAASRLREAGDTIS
jgi:UDPglucose--hexose-1-phosphate uridylyltransferase